MLVANLVLLLVIVGGASASVAVWTNAFGMGVRWQHLLDRIELALNPPPDRATADTLTVTPRPVGTPTPPATPVGTLAPGATPTPRPTPTPTPRRTKVDVKVVANPAKIFAHEVTVDMCAAAGVQIVMLAHGVGDASDAFQRRLQRKVPDWESWRDSHNGKWGPGAMVAALDAYGVPGYEIRAYATRDDALLDAARAISQTHAPAILLAWRGAHTWIMSGYRATADPLVFDDAKVTGAYILDPWYPDISSIWGPSDPPGAFQDTSEMVRNFLPWKRPEGLYPQRDGKFIVVAPTISIGG